MHRIDFSRLICYNTLKVGDDMKKLIAIFMCLAMCLSFVGCNNTEKQNSEAKELLQKVLDKEQNFSYKCLVFDKVTEESLNKFKFHTEYSALNPFVPYEYAYVDFDSDGIEELVIVDAMLKFFLILRYDNGNVNGYILENISLQDIKTDGSFLTVIHNRYTAVSRVSFDGLHCAVTNLAYKNDSANTYQLNQKSATRDEVERYFDDWNEDTIKISWVTIK